MNKIKQKSAVNIPREDLDTGSHSALELETKDISKLEALYMSSASLKILAQNSLSTFSHN